VCKILRAYLTLPSQALGEELAMSEGELRRRSACMRHLVQRIGDASEEDVVKNFIIDTFQESWFGDEFSSLQLSGLNGFADEPTGGVSHDLAPPGWMMVENANDSTEGDIEEDSSATKGRSKQRSPEFVSPDGRTFNTAEEAWTVYRRPQVTPSSVVKSKQSKHDDTVATVCTIVEVVQGIATMDWFVALLKRLLYNDQPKTSAGKRPSRDRSDDASIARSRSEKIVACLVDSLMQLEERKVLKGVTGSDKDSQFLSCMKALSAFSEANPHLLSPHLEALMVYLKGDDKFSTSTESKIQSLVVNMVSNEIAHAGRVTDRIATRLESDLQDLILRAPPSVVGPSIKCLATMATHTKRPPTLLLKLLGWFFSFLEKYRQEQSLANKEPDIIGKLQRALFTVGQIGGALDFDSANFDLPVRTDPPFDKLAKGSTMDTLYDVFSAFLKIPGNPACTAKAVQGLGFLFMVRPRLLMQAQQEGLLDALMTSPSHEVRLQALSCLKELLQHEENRLEKGVERKKTLSKSKSKKGQVEGDQDGEGSLVGSVMQVQLTNLLNLTVEKNVRIRSEAVSCVAVLLTQGLISPLLCIPTLVALEADHVVSIRDIAHSQLLALHEKLPTQIHQPAVKGVFISHTFQVNAFGASTVYALDKEKNEYSLFGRLYTACLRPVRSQRNMFLRALTNQFSDNGTVLTSNNLVTKPLKTVEYLSFLAQFVTSLPFDVEDEPLFIIYHINRNVTLTLGYETGSSFGY
jgi:cohesin loading factor subunit SCC2